MSIQQEEKLKEIFFAAIEKQSSEREQYLAQVCSDNNITYQEIIALLDSHEEAKDFLERPAADLAARLIKEEQTKLPTSKTDFLDRLTGATLDGKYLIEKQLGQGGMGAVYQATHLGTKRPVALKVIAPQFMMYPEFVERFKREAEAAGRLSHPNVVNVTDFGIAKQGNSNVAYLVMEYLNGCTLGALLKKRGALPVGFTVDVIEQVCFAVEEAHRQGIIHRDLKPDNIWLEPDGRGGFHVKVLDFGLAKLHTTTPQIAGNSSVTEEVTSVEPLKRANNAFNSLATMISQGKPNVATAIKLPVPIKPTGVDGEEQTQVLPAKANTRIQTDRDSAGTIDPTSVPEWLTRVGMVLGTPLYMSPEQCHGQELDARSDIYSIGIVAYEMLIGETPFSGDLYQLTQKHSEMPPPPLRDKRRNLPKAIAELIMSSLAKNPNERPISAKAFAVALRANVEGERPLLNRAFEIYRNNFSVCLRVSAAVNLPFALFGWLLSIGLPIKFNLPYAGVIQWALWLCSLLILLIGDEINTAAFTMVLGQTQTQPQGKVNVSAIIYSLARQLPTVMSTVLRVFSRAILQSWKLIVPAFRSYVENSLSGSIAISEEMKGYSAMQRSTQLLKRFFSLAASLKLRALLIRVMAFSLFFIMLFVNGVLIDWTHLNLFSQIATSVVLSFLVPGLFIAITSPLVNIAMAQLYFKAREANGENLYQVKQSYEEMEIAERMKLTGRRKLVLAASLIVTMLFSAFSFVIIVPPLGTIKPLVHPLIEKIPDEQNAWVEYDLAIQDLLEFENAGSSFTREASNKSMQDFVIARTLEMIKDKGYDKLTDAAYGFTEFNQQHLDYLDHHQGAIKHLLAGVKRPKAQFYTEAPSYDSPVPNLMQTRNICTIAVAQARRLSQEGKQQEAAELMLAAYRMGTDMAEPNSTLFSPLIGVVCRGIGAGAMFNWLRTGGGDAATDRIVAQKVAALGEQMMTPYQAIMGEQQVADLTMENLLVKKIKFHRPGESMLTTNDLVMSGLMALPGLRLRFYNSYIANSEKYRKNAGAALKNWDFEALGNLKLGNRPDLSLSPIDLAAFYMMNGIYSSPLPTTRSLYHDKAMNIALQCFAAFAAYEKTHGKFPETLGAVMSEVGLIVPIDPATGKQIGYRLENGKPVIWLAGVDGKDDGGKSCYDRAGSHTVTPGKDLIFRFGEMPFYFQPSS